MVCDLEPVDLDDRPAWRVGYEPDPWRFPDWRYASGPGRFDGRWDDPEGRYRVLYAASDPFAAYVEVLADFRPDPAVVAGLEEIEVENDVDDDGVARLIEDLSSDGRLDGQGGLSPRTVRYIYNLLRRALEDAVTWGFIDRNPARGILPRKPGPRRARRPRGTWNSEQLDRFRQHARSHRLAAAWILVVNAGLRRGELLGLGWRNVDLDAATLTVAMAYVTVNGDAQLVPPRSRHARRAIHLDQGTVETLAGWRDRQLAEREEAAGAWADHGLVVTQPNGRPIDPDNFTKIFTRLVRRARLPHVSLRDLRMMHAVRLFDDGVDPDDVARRLGVHSGYYLQRACLTYLAETHLPEAAPNSRPSMEGTLR